MESLDWDDMPIGASFDPIHVISSWNMPQRQEAATRLVADFMAAKSGADLKYSEMGFSSSPILNMPTYISDNCNPMGLSGLVGNFGSNYGLQEVKPTSGLLSATGSLESLDCLLSVTTTTNNTDTSIEDDGMSMIFADNNSKSLWPNFNASNVVSSVDSTVNVAYEAALKQSSGYQQVVTRMPELVSESGILTREVKKIPRGEEIKRNKRSRDQALLEPDGASPSALFNLLQSDTSNTNCNFQLISEKQVKSKKPRMESNNHPSSSNINFQQASSSASSIDQEPDPEAIAQMKEMIYRAAAFRPVNFGTEVQEKPKRKNVRISTDPQTVAARQRRERISERIRVLQGLVPGGSKMDTASMLDEAANYLKFLRSQVKALEALGQTQDPFSSMVPFNYPFPMQTHFPLQNPNPINRPKS